jgi:hypothetical protein
MKLVRHRHCAGNRPAGIRMLSQDSGLTVAHAWAFAPTPSGTELHLMIDFTLPAQWLTGFRAPMLARQNRQQVAIALTNLRQALESDIGRSGRSA